MGGVCVCCPWTCTPVWPLFIILATLPCVLHCSESPAAIGGKIYPRGNHWAVGHLMGKKSTESLPVLQETHLLSSDTARVTELDQYEPLIEMLMQETDQKQMKPQTGEKLLHLRSAWREEDRDKYLRELSDLLLLALKLQGSEST